MIFKLKRPNVTWTHFDTSAISFPLSMSPFPAATAAVSSRRGFFGLCCFFFEGSEQFLNVRGKCVESWRCIRILFEKNRPWKAPWTSSCPVVGFLAPQDTSSAGPARRSPSKAPATNSQQGLQLTVFCRRRFTCYLCRKYYIQNVTEELCHFFPPHFTYLVIVKFVTMQVL